MKKLFSLILVFAMMMAAFVAPVSAAAVTAGTSTDTKGKITIGNAKAGETYSIYQIMELESYDTTKPAYAYKATEAWADFFTTDAAKAYFKVDNGYITLKEGVANNTDTAKAIAAAALAYAKDANNNISATASVVATADGAEFSNLQLGYYLVESTLGVVLSLNTTANEVVIDEKNTTTPVVEKVIGSNLTISNGKIGDVVPYTITLQTINGKKNVIAHDTLSAGLTFNNDVVVYLNGTTENNVVAATNYENVTANGETFAIKLKDSYVATLTATDVVYIKYTATINASSVTAVPNTNEAYISYGNGQRTESEITETYTYGLQFNKIDGDTNAALTGAKFKLYDAATAGNEIKVVFVKTENNVNYYRVATAAEASRAVEMDAGVVQVDGLDVTKTYYLQETVAPEGYNKLGSRIALTIAAKAQDATNYVYANTAVPNTTGAVLPSTGGMGTVLFVTIGSMMVMATGISLITKFRMSKES